MADEEPTRAVTLVDSELSEMHKNERIKVESRGLFQVADPKEPHSFRDEVEALERGDAATISNTAKELSKFFGIYKQQGRGERGKKTKDYFFMVRIKNPGGGRLSPRQWATLDDAADAHADGTLRITSRQGIQYHHVYGPQLAPLIRDLNRGYREPATLGGCGDVNRNVMVSPVDELDPESEAGALELAREIAEELAPKTTAYFQIFRSDDEGRNFGAMNSTEPIYGEHYMPRKFKIGFAHPTDNAVDVLTQDVGFVPVGRDGRLWDLYSGGGLGLTHNNPKTAPHLGLYHGRIRREQVVDAAKAIAILQKEHGERKDRKQARWKYTIRRLGLERVNEELRERFGLALEAAEPVAIPPFRWYLGWNEGRDGRGYYGLSIENGRVQPDTRKAVRAAVEELGASVMLTPLHDLLLCDVADREALERILRAHGVAEAESVSRVRANAMACPAKPTCGLAMTDAEHVLPGYIDAIEEAGYGDVDAVIRMTGCPNNCARPPTAEIGIYGYGKNDHVVLIGGSREGTRLGKVLYERLPEEQMVPALVGLFREIKRRETDGLPVGELLHRADPTELRDAIGVEGAV